MLDHGLFLSGHHSAVLSPLELRFPPSPAVSAAPAADGRSSRTESQLLKQRSCPRVELALLAWAWGQAARLLLSTFPSRPWRRRTVPWMMNCLTIRETRVSRAERESVALVGQGWRALSFPQLVTRSFRDSDLWLTEPAWLKDLPLEASSSEVEVE